VATNRGQRLPFRHAQAGDAGIAFIDYVDHLAGNNRLLRQRQLAFLHEWDVLVDELGRVPTAAEYAERWRTPRSTVYSLLDEFRQLFDGQNDPTWICKEIWDGSRPSSTRLRLDTWTWTAYG
jgi:hypothetical protein